MKTSIVVAAAFAGLAAAQAGEIPKCAQSCVSEQISGGSYAGCGTNAKCICENDNFLSTVACCLVGVCSEADQAAAVEYAQQICSAQGVQVPTAVSCTTGATAATTGAGTSATGTGGALTTAASGSGSTTAAASGTTAASGSGTAATAAVTSSSSSGFAPQQTGMRGAEILGGLVAAVALL
ncbi:putative extracellular membrane protein [Phaeoacremonium minimum UCRPA7]|uniref:Putative extracellular membrane protein n=1 Tax=Phaeoacremonium minimum (strain UCR-PA7) TaxID=1286976 RepID=R8BV87_PHAM7|nr:putative extracellular membrane protein [Phaeoacremonium minimum UCRPA7]EOO03209.1 putative extracellular membrane protein [Phaeoacremonium minimum UCRPA7]